MTASDVMTFSCSRSFASTTASAARTPFRPASIPYKRKAQRVNCEFQNIILHIWNICTIIKLPPLGLKSSSSNIKSSRFLRECLFRRILFWFILIGVLELARECSFYGWKEIVYKSGRFCLIYEYHFFSFKSKHSKDIVILIRNMKKFLVWTIWPRLYEKVIVWQLSHCTLLVQLMHTYRIWYIQTMWANFYYILCFTRMHIQ